MNKRKAKDKSAEQPPPRLFRSFKPYEVEQVMEVMRMLYALRPAMLRPKLDSKSELQWNLLAREASDFLDKSHKACSEIARQRSLGDAAYRRAETRSAEAEKLPEIVPLNRALRETTNQHTTERAKRNFKKFVLNTPRYFGGLLGKAPTLRTLNAQIAHWKKTGIPRGEVVQLQAVFENSWPRIIAEENRRKAKKRKQWKDERISKKLSDTARKIT